jgi:ABC-type glycerol-3-phosphate transport system substrate-binding protein
MLVGCTQKNKITEKPKDELEGTITIWSTKDNHNLLDLSAKNFNKLHNKVSINIVEVGTNDILDKFQVAQISKLNLPDMLCVNDEDVQRLLKKGFEAFEDIGDDLKKDSYLKYKIENLTFNSKLYGFPLGSKPVVMVYRNDMMQTAGINIEYIKTWDDYIVKGKTAADKTGKAMAVLPFEDEKTYRVFLNQLSGSYFDKDGKLEVNSSKGIRALEVLKKIYNSGVVKNAKSHEEMINLFKSGDTLSAILTAEELSSMHKQLPELKEKLQVMRLPAFEEGGNQAINASGSNLIIINSSSNKKLVVDFAKFAVENRDNIKALINELGVYPSYTNNYDEKGFGDKKFLELLDEIYSINYTENFYKITDSIKEAVSSSIIKAQDSKTVLDELQKSLSIQIK